MLRLVRGTEESGGVGVEAVEGERAEVAMELSGCY